MTSLFNILISAAMTLVLGASLAAAQNEAPREQREQREQRDPREMRPRPPELTEQELEDVLAFMREYLPNRFEMFEQLSPSQQARSVFLRNLTQRYRNLQRMKEQDASVYNAMLQHMQLQDEVFGLMRDARFGDEDAQGKLREKVKELVMLSLEEREKRVQSLERSLEQEKKRLAADKADPDAAVERRLRQMRDEADDVRSRFDELRAMREQYRPGPGVLRPNRPFRDGRGPRDAAGPNDSREAEPPATAPTTQPDNR
jgi:hypothetical protein